MKTPTVLLCMCAGLILAGCGQKPGGDAQPAGNAENAAPASSGDEEWLTRQFGGISVKVPSGWKVSASNVFSAYSSEGLACVLMKPAQIIPRSKASTAAEYLAEALDSYEKYGIGQPVTRLGEGEMPLAGKTAAWVEMSYDKPKTWQRVICVVTDKPYILFCWARHDNSGERSEDRRVLPFEEYRTQVVEIANTITSK